VLGELSRQRSRRQVFRFAEFSTTEQFMAQLQLDQRSSEELWALLANSGRDAQFDELLDGPFRRKRKLQTRFSDGSYPVLYSSLDTATAEAEIRYWFLRSSGQPQAPQTRYYWQFSCAFDGIEKDLRSKVQDWPDLVHDSDYSFCNQLGAEAKRVEIDGLVTWSVRQKEGVNLPVFTRHAVSKARLEGLVAMTYHPSTGDVFVQRVAEQATH
jgi:hypothetical protein